MLGPCILTTCRFLSEKKENIDISVVFPTQIHSNTNISIQIQNTYNLKLNKRTKDTH